MQHVFNDGGRAEAGFKGRTDDCVARAIAIVSGKPYRSAYDLVAIQCKLAGLPKSGRQGIPKHVLLAIMREAGLEWTATMRIGQGTKVHMMASELPAGRLIVRLSGHVAAVIDGVLHDTYDCTREGTRCVYGYWRLTRR